MEGGPITGAGSAPISTSAPHKTATGELRGPPSANSAASARNESLRSMGEACFAACIRRCAVRFRSSRLDSSRRIKAMRSVVAASSMGISKLRHDAAVALESPTSIVPFAPA